jgi:hypothetical protein
MLPIKGADVNAGYIINEGIPVKKFTDIKKCLNDIIQQMICETVVIEHKKEYPPVN